MRMMKVALVGAALLVSAARPGWTQSAEDAFGTWVHPENGSHVKITPCGKGALCATIVSVKDPSRRDDKNPNPKLRNRPIPGITIMSGAKKTGEASWSGKLYNTQDGQTYSGTVTVIDKDHLKLQGCVLGGLICQGPTWTRVR